MVCPPKYLLLWHTVLVICGKYDISKELTGHLLHSCACLSGGTVLQLVS